MEEQYTKLRLLGEGSFGKCYLVKCQSDGSTAVIKQMNLAGMSEQEIKETLKEAKILEAFNHPNIIKFKEVFKTKTGRLCIVMDYADGGDLQKKITNQNKKFFPENQIIDYFVQMCLAIKHIHDRKVLHRDIKSQNIFLTKNNIVKLGDFGIAKVLEATKQNARTMVGTPYYLSPEIVESRPYGFKSDIWSLGVLLYELCALKPPFDASSLHYLALKIVQGNFQPIPTHYSKEIKSLVSSLLQSDPQKRPTVNQILKLPIITKRMQTFLTQTLQKQEFSHTIIHNQNLFQIAQNRQNQVKAPEENKKSYEEIKEQEKKRQLDILRQQEVIRKQQEMKKQEEEKQKQKELLRQEAKRMEDKKQQEILKQEQIKKLQEVKRQEEVKQRELLKQQEMLKEQQRKKEEEQKKRDLARKAEIEKLKQLEEARIQKGREKQDIKRRQELKKKEEEEKYKEEAQKIRLENHKNRLLANQRLQEERNISGQVFNAPSQRQYQPENYMQNQEVDKVPGQPKKNNLPLNPQNSQQDQRKQQLDQQYKENEQRKQEQSLQEDKRPASSNNRDLERKEMLADIKKKQQSSRKEKFPQVEIVGFKNSELDLEANQVNPLKVEKQQERQNKP